MTEADRIQIKRLWESRVAIEQIVQMLPYRHSEARRMIAELRANGTLTPRRKIEMASAKIAEAYKGGIKDIAELCEVFGYSKHTIKAYLRKGGVQRGRPSHYNRNNFKPLNEKTQLIIYELANGEKSLSEIAKQVGVSRQYVHQLRNRMEKLNEIKRSEDCAD